jgi:hypothetical protein
MSELANNIRALHAILVGVAAALLGFALSPNDSDRYLRARDELQIVRTIPFASFPDFVDPTTEERESVRKGLVDRLKLARIPFKVLPDLEFEAPLYIASLPDSTSDLNKICDFLAYNTIVCLVTPHSDLGPVLEDSIARGLFKCRSGVYETDCHSIPGDSTLFRIKFRPSSEAKMDRSQTPESLRRSLHLTNGDFLEYWHKMPSNYVSKLAFEFGRRNGEPVIAIHDVELGLAIVGSPNEKTALALLKALPNPYPSLIGGTNSSPVILPALEEVWQEVSHSTPDDAVALIDAKLSGTRRSLSMLGITVDERVVVVAGSTVLMFLSVYLLAQLRNLASLLGKPDGSEKVPLAWPCFFSDWLSQMVSYVSILLLPVAAAISLIARAGRWSEPRSVIALTATICILVSGISALRRLKAIRISLHQIP